MMKYRISLSFILFFKYFSIYKIVYKNLRICAIFFVYGKVLQNESTKRAKTTQNIRRTQKKCGRRRKIICRNVYSFHPSSFRPSADRYSFVKYFPAPE